MQTSYINTDPNREPRRIAMAIVILAVGLGIRLILAAQVQHPGHADYAFYYTVAENLADGRGLQVDYIWHYLNPPPGITHASNDYWMPLPSIIIAAPMLVFGTSLFIALLPSVLAGVLLAWVGYLLAFEYTRSRPAALGCLSLLLFLPPLFEHSLRTEGTLFYALFVTSSLLLLIKSRRRAWLFLPAVVLAGLAQLTRQDGLLVVLVLFVSAWFSSWPKKTKIRYTLVGLVVYLATLSPMMIVNYKTIGSPFPPSTAKTLFLTDYEDLYSYSKDLTPGSYLGSGIAGILRSKARMALANVYTLFTNFGQFLSIFTVIGVVLLIRGRREKNRLGIWLPPVLVLGALYVFYTLVIGFGSSFDRSSLAVAPFVVILVVLTIRRLVPTGMSAAIIALLTAWFFFQSVQLARLNIRSDARMDRDLNEVAEIVSADADKRGREDIVIMTRNPWDVYQSTRYKAIQIPNDDLEVIYEVARRYGADYLLLPAPRQALDDIYTGERHDDRFPFVACIAYSDLKLFRIDMDDSK